MIVPSSFLKALTLGSNFCPTSTTISQITGPWQSRALRITVSILLELSDLKYEISYA